MVLEHVSYIFCVLRIREKLPSRQMAPLAPKQSRFIACQCTN